MGIGDRLQQLFQDTFLDLFAEKEVSSTDLTHTLQQAQKQLQTATDALAAYTATHLTLKAEQEQAQAKLNAIAPKLKQALNEGDDNQARYLIRQRNPLRETVSKLADRLAESEAHLDRLKTQFHQMKQQQIEIVERQAEIEQRDRAADATSKLANAQNAIDDQHSQATSFDAEHATLVKESVNALNEEKRETPFAPLDTQLEQDEIEQELAQLKASNEGTKS